MNYCRGVHTPKQRNQQFGIPREIVRGFSPRLRELVGYGTCQGLIGDIDKGPRRCSGPAERSDGSMIGDKS